jgi:hypothetical protein
VADWTGRTSGATAWNGRRDCVAVHGGREREGERAREIDGARYLQRERESERGRERERGRGRERGERESERQREQREAHPRPSTAVAGAPLRTAALEGSSHEMPQLRQARNKAARNVAAVGDGSGTCHSSLRMHHATARTNARTHMCARWQVHACISACTQAQRASVALRKCLQARACLRPGVLATVRASVQACNIQRARCKLSLAVNMQLAILNTHRMTQRANVSEHALRATLWALGSSASAL